MHIADFLSRPCSFNLGDREIKQSMISDDLMYGVQEDKLLDTLQTDSIAIKMRGIVRNKWLKTNEGMGKETNLCLWCEIVLLVIAISFNNRFYIAYLSVFDLVICSKSTKSTKSTKEFFKCRNRAKELFWWPGLSNEIATYGENW